MHFDKMQVDNNQELEKNLILCKNVNIIYNIIECNHESQSLNAIQSLIKWSWAQASYLIITRVWLLHNRFFVLQGPHIFIFIYLCMFLFVCSSIHSFVYLLVKTLKVAVAVDVHCMNLRGPNYILFKVFWRALSKTYLLLQFLNMFLKWKPKRRKITWFIFKFRFIELELEGKKGKNLNRKSLQTIFCNAFTIRPVIQKSVLL